VQKLFESVLCQILIFSSVMIVGNASLVTLYRVVDALTKLSVLLRRYGSAEHKQTLATKLQGNVLKLSLQMYVEYVCVCVCVCVRVPEQRQ
jgi:hypothetical protein